MPSVSTTYQSALLSVVRRFKIVKNDLIGSLPNSDPISKDAAEAENAVVTLRTRTIRITAVFFTLRKAIPPFDLFRFIITHP